jgi:hypothetical protein
VLVLYILNRLRVHQISFAPDTSPTRRFHAHTTVGNCQEASWLRPGGLVRDLDFENAIS